VSARALVWVVAVGLLAPPLAVDVEAATSAPRVGILGSAAGSPRWEAFRRGLRDLGYTEGLLLRVDRMIDP
jgi:putative ABC transport system substrate-binding protein